MKKRNQVSVKDIFGLPSINFENLLNLPCCVFRKDKEGIYLEYNDYGAIKLGYSSGREIIGKNDFEVFTEECAKSYRENDQAVLKERKSLFAPEKGVLKKTQVIFLSYKMPLYDENKVIIGIAGMSFIQTMCDLNHSTVENSSIAELEKVCNSCRQKTRLNCAGLSEKEKTCLHYLCQGFTLKMIAQQLKLSPKTIETYLERAKIKMNCHNKAQLVSAFIKANLVRQSEP